MSDDNREIFCAALQAAITGTAIREGGKLPKPEVAVDYARRVVRATYGETKQDQNTLGETFLDFVGAREITGI